MSRARLALAPFLAALALVPGCASEPISRVQQQALDANQRGARAFQAGRLDEARQRYEEAARFDASIENFDGVAANLLSLARVEQAAGKRAAAHAYLDRVLAEEPGAAPLARQAEAAARKAQLHLAGRELERAAELSARAEELCRRSRCASMAAILNLRGLAALRAGEPQAAIAFSLRAIGESRGEGGRAERANALRLGAEAQLAQNEAQAAFGALEEALRIDQALGQPARIFEDLMLLGQASEQLGRRDDARTFYQRALSVGGASRDTAAQTQARTRLERVQRQIN